MTISEKINKFIDENRRSERDALNVALSRLERAETALRQITETDGTFSASTLEHANNTIAKMRAIADSYIKTTPTVIFE